MVHLVKVEESIAKIEENRSNHRDQSHGCSWQLGVVSRQIPANLKREDVKLGIIWPPPFGEPPLPFVPHLCTRRPDPRCSCSREW
jgi:hypothetical protein